MSQNKATEDSLVYMPLEEWRNIQSEFKGDWPRGIPAYWALEIQRQWAERGLTYDFKVFCPLGDPVNGMVAINNKKNFNELIIHCPNDNTTQLEDALRRTKIINWKQKITIPFSPFHIINCIKNITKDVNIILKESNLPHEMFLNDKKKPLFQQISLPEDVTFKLLTEDHIDVTDLNWINRYNGSKWYLGTLIRTKVGYGIFKGDELACWVFNNEVGALSHFFTLEKFRREHYAELLIKFVVNIQTRENKDSFGYCMIGNVNASNLYYKLGFEKCYVVNRCFLEPIVGL